MTNSIARLLPYIFQATSVVYVLGPIMGWLSMDLNPVLGASFFYSLTLFPFLTLTESILGALAGLAFLVLSFVYTGSAKGKALFAVLTAQAVVQGFIFCLVLYRVIGNQAELQPASLLVDCGFLLAFLFYAFRLPSQIRVKGYPSLEASAVSSAMNISFWSLFMFSMLGWGSLSGSPRGAELIQASGHCIQRGKASVWIPKGCLYWPQEKSSSDDSDVFDVLCGTQVEKRSWYDTYSVSMGDASEDYANKSRICLEVSHQERSEIECSKIQHEVITRIRFQADTYPDERTIRRSYEQFLDPFMCEKP